MRSLHRILQGFKKTAMANQRRSASAAAAGTSSTGSNKLTPQITPGQSFLFKYSIYIHMSLSYHTRKITNDSLPVVGSTDYPDPTDLSATSSHTVMDGAVDISLPSEWDADFLNSDDLFANWDNWPQFDPSDFSDLFQGVFDWEAPSEGAGV